LGAAPAAQKHWCVSLGVSGARLCRWSLRVHALVAPHIPKNDYRGVVDLPAAQPLPSTLTSCLPANQIGSWPGPDDGRLEELRHKVRHSSSVAGAIRLIGIDKRRYLRRQMNGAWYDYRSEHSLRAHSRSSCSTSWAARSIVQLYSCCMPDISLSKTTRTFGKEIESRPVFRKPRRAIIRRAIYRNS
jgi:hypothetical protein